ncbi:MAG TPA: methyltransferase domain-containing protein [Rhizomicrobium sp.]|jgi:ubiquinone/menaquinone biosynthesis C-methylase UbiE|nr:methyltransferase domain-containing protein [Rhizomicrobium sp.]
MSYADLLDAVAKENGIATAAELVNKHGQKYHYLIKSRDRARELVGAFGALLETSFRGQKVLEVGCGAGSLAIELFHLGAEVTAIESSTHWMAMAQEHVKNEATVSFIRADLLHGMDEMPEHSFDTLLAVDALPKMYDLFQALVRMRRLLKPGGALAFRVPSSTSPMTVDDKRGLGLPLVAPDYWSVFVKTPIGQYQRPWAVYRALLKAAGFTEPSLSVPIVDESLERAQYKVRAQLSAIKKKLKARETLADPKAYIYARNALKPYIRTAEHDLEHLSWEDLNLKYRAPSWIGVAHAT